MQWSPDISLEIIHVVLLSFLTVSCLCGIQWIQRQNYQEETETQPLKSQKGQRTFYSFLKACVYSIFSNKHCVFIQCILYLLYMSTYAFEPSL